MSDLILKVVNLQKNFPTKSGVVQALDNINFTIKRGSVVGLVGESGSGKTTLGRSILRLIEPSSGEVVFNGQDITKLSAKDMVKMRKSMQIIFQDPYASLNPRLKVEQILSEPLIAHHIGKNKTERREIIAGLLQEVGLNADHMHRFPHEFSGGQRQRIGIARALAVNPEFIIADESVSALDVSVQAQILNLLQDLCEKRGLTIFFIAHDLSVVEYLCDEVIVLYLGHIVEAGSSTTIYREPKHPYTKALLAAAPLPDPTLRREKLSLKGDIPSPLNPPSGCVFQTRCDAATDCCRHTPPPEQQLGDGRKIACWLFNEKTHNV